MPIDSLHPHFKVMQDDIIDCRAAFDGGRAIKAAGVGDGTAAGPCWSPADALTARTDASIAANTKFLTSFICVLLNML